MNKWIWDLLNKPLSQQGNKYEVLLSCSRSEDTPKSFSSRLYSCMREVGISVLNDDMSIEILRSINIEGSKISIIIFSERYAGSRWCLEELTQILEFHRAHDHVVIPIFYGVDPSEVRDVRSRFGKAFQRLIQTISPPENEVSRWRTAIREAGRNYGFFVPDSDFKKQGKHIANIVKRVRQILNGKCPFDTEGLVGVSSQVQEVIRMLQKHQSKAVVSIGIWGMAGIGKTILAGAIFDHIRHEFESTRFLSIDREAWKTGGRFYLQKELESVLCIEKRLIVDERDSVEYKKIFLCKKIFLVVDDVNHLGQLDVLSEYSVWFGEGTRIIMTTRDLHLLQASKVDDEYSVKLLSDQESLQLLKRTVFKQASPEGEFIELCRRVVAYSEGLPLALKVLGSIMRGQLPKEWESALKKLSTHLPPAIYKTLKLSFDSLDGNILEIFLNIVLFHIGEEKNDVIQKLDARGCNARIGITALVGRSLLTIDSNNKVRMHHLLQLMGRQIISQISQNDLPNRGYRYEVFLSFRGEDTRVTFTSHLYSALCNAGIIVFKDDVELPRGNYIKTELLQAIGSSKIAIIIFSKEYAASKWCLEELSIIMELHKSNHQRVLPVFYDVDPSEIRHQTSSFGEAFKDLIQTISPAEAQVSNWRTVLANAGGIAGIVVLRSKDESENVKAIVEHICNILDKKNLFVADHPVGVDNRVQEVITMLKNHQSEDVVMVGIWGMGGVGKTTIAKAIYNEIGRMFDSRSYLSKIREVWDQEKEQVNLQNQLLTEICKTTQMKINSIESGIITLSDRLHHKKALVVLDDVDESAQLKALVGSRDWFKPGSRIVITTRNKRLLY